MQRAKVIFIGAGLLLAASPAFADGDGGGSASGGATVGAGAEVGAGGAAVGGGAAVTVGGDATMGAWPLAIIDRPLTLVKSGLGLYGNLEILRVSSTFMGMTSSATAEGLQLGGGYGVSDKLTIGAEYAFSLHSFEIKGPLTLYGSLALMRNDKLTIGASADLVIDLNAVNAMGMSSTTETLQAGLGIRYKLAPKIAIFTGTPIAPGPLGQHLSIGFQSGAPIAIDLPVGLAIQATPQVYLWVNTEIAHLKISNTTNEFFGADFIPLTVGALYAANKNLDVGGFLELPDLKNSKFDILVFGVGARWYQ